MGTSKGFGYMSLLWPGERSFLKVPEQTWKDLGLEQIVEALTLDRRRAAAIEGIIRMFPNDEATINYRLAVMEELVDNASLGDALERAVPVIDRLRYYVFRPDRSHWAPIQKVAWRIQELEHYVELLEILRNGFSSMEREAASEGLSQLFGMVREAREAPIFKRLKEKLPELLRAVAAFRSISLGINLDGGLEPEAVTVLSVGSEPYRDNGLLNRLVGSEDTVGLTKLHTALLPDRAANPALTPLFRDLSTLLKKSVRPLADALTEFTSLNTGNFVSLGDELLFFAGGVTLARRLREEGLPLCRPTIATMVERRFEAEALYNLDLPLRRPAGNGSTERDSSLVVTSDVQSGSAKRIFIVTGPNNGGKTTFLQAVGLAQIFAQLGLFAPAERMTFSPVDTILTHYPALERREDDRGRFGEEAVRLRDILVRLSEYSLLLMNETLSSTAMGEAIYLAEDVLELISEIGCRAVYVTHMHGLARLEAESILSFVATTREVAGEHVPTFRMVPGKPEGKSYAADIAARCGLELGALRTARERAANV